MSILKGSDDGVLQYGLLSYWTLFKNTPSTYTFRHHRTGVLDHTVSYISENILKRNITFPFSEKLFDSEAAPTAPSRFEEAAIIEN